MLPLETAREFAEDRRGPGLEVLIQRLSPRLGVVWERAVAEAPPPAPPPVEAGGGAVPPPGPPEPPAPRPASPQRTDQDRWDGQYDRVVKMYFRRLPMRDCLIHYRNTLNPSARQTEFDKDWYDCCYVAISAGRSHVCAMTAQGAVYCWGHNRFFESGPGADSLNNTRTPTPVPGPVLAKVAAGWAYHSCGVAAAGAAYCWGNNNKGQLGAGASAPETCGLDTWPCRATPVAVEGGLTFKSISAGVEFTCGVTTSGDLVCWGDNSHGQLGTGDRKSRSTPGEVAGP